MHALLLVALLIGDPAPTLALRPLDGSAPITLAAAAAGRLTVVDFFATWCAPCRAQLPVMERLRRRYPDVTFVSVSEDGDPAAVPAFVRANHVEGRVLLDPDRRAFGALGGHKLPTTVVLDGAGVVRKINHGFGPGFEARLGAWLDELSRARR